MTKISGPMLSLPTAMAVAAGGGSAGSWRRHGRAVGIQLLVVDMLVGADDENLGTGGVVACGDGQGSPRSAMNETGCGDAGGVKQLVVDLLVGADDEGFRHSW